MTTPNFAVQAVALPVPVFATGAVDAFYYRLPDRASSLPAGCRVRVPFGSRELIGVTVTGPSDPEGTDSSALKPVIEVLDATPIIPADLVQLLTWASRYYHYPLGEVIAAALPKLIRQGRAIETTERVWQWIDPDVAVSEIGRSTTQQATYRILRLHDEHGAPEPALMHLGAKRSALHALEKKGLVRSSLQLVAPKALEPVRLSQPPLTPSAQQAQAIGHITALQGAFGAVLLEGLTGSGKTEVYLQAMQSVLESGQQVLVLVPEIGLTPQTLSRFQSRFHTDIAVLHSGVSEGARMDAWTRARRGEARIVIGTRSAVFTPLPNLGLIILDEEHDLSYKQQDGFRYHARDVALRRAQQRGCPVVLGSATPSLESLQRVEAGKMAHARLTERAGHAQAAKVQLLDLRGISRPTGISPALSTAIEQTLDAGNQVLVFLNRRGFAPILLCESCGWQADCPQCDAHLTVHQQPRHLHCHHCNYQSRFPTHCPACNSPNLLPIGVGTARLEESLRERFPQTPIIRVDRDTTSRVGSWEAIYHQTQRDEPAILIGTQMLAKGHHFPYVTLVAILNIDSGLLSADFRAAERTGQLLIQVAGRSGRGDRAGQVLIQTYQPDNPILAQLIREGYHAFARDELTSRQHAHLPPFNHAALLRAESPTADKTQQFLQHAINTFKAQAGSKWADVWGPIPAPMEKKAGVYRGHTLILCSDRRQLHQLIGTWWRDTLKSPERRGVRISLDIDPLELS